MSAGGSTGVNGGGDNIYFVENILKSRIKKGKTEYLIKWKGWDSVYNTWEPEENLLDTKVVEEFKAKRFKHGPSSPASSTMSSHSPSHQQSPHHQTHPQPQPHPPRLRKERKESKDKRSTTTMASKSPSISVASCLTEFSLSEDRESDFDRECLFAELPPRILFYIFSFLPASSLKALRQVNSACNLMCSCQFKVTPSSPLYIPRPPSQSSARTCQVVSSVVDQAVWNKAPEYLLFLKDIFQQYGSDVRELTILHTPPTLMEEWQIFPVFTSLLKFSPNVTTLELSLYFKNFATFQYPLFSSNSLLCPFNSLKRIKVDFVFGGEMDGRYPPRIKGIVHHLFALCPGVETVEFGGGRRGAAVKTIGLQYLTSNPEVMVDLQEVIMKTVHKQGANSNDEDGTYQALSELNRPIKRIELGLVSSSKWKFMEAVLSNFSDSLGAFDISMSLKSGSAEILRIPHMMKLKQIKVRICGEKEEMKGDGDASSSGIALTKSWHRDKTNACNDFSPFFNTEDELKERLPDLEELEITLE